jgi:4-hydroxybenzoate polyprenyltransferase
MNAFLRLVRIENLLFIAGIQFLIKYALLVPFGVATALSGLHFTLLVIATVSLAAAGYIINDLQDGVADQINKPKKVALTQLISEKSAYNYFIGFNVLGVAIGFYLSNYIERPALVAFFIGISAMLYIYSTFLKYILIVKNLTIAVLAALVLIVVGIFDLMPALTEANQGGLQVIFLIILDYAFFAFSLTFLREIVKDIQDMDGDKNADLKTLPIVLGVQRTVTISFVLGVLHIVGVVYYIYQYLYKQPVAILYFLLLVIAPLIVFCILLWSRKTRQEFGQLATLLKIIMALGMLSMALYPWLLK